jgi:hypothetical protein
MKPHNKRTLVHLSPLCSSANLERNTIFDLPQLDDEEISLKFVDNFKNQKYNGRPERHPSDD